MMLKWHLSMEKKPLIKRQGGGRGIVDMANENCQQPLRYFGLGIFFGAFLNRSISFFITFSFFDLNVEHLCGHMFSRRLSGRYRCRRVLVISLLWQSLLMMMSVIIVKPNNPNLMLSLLDFVSVPKDLHPFSICEQLNTIKQLLSEPSTYIFRYIG